MQLIHGQKVGQHKIIEYIGTSVFGDTYSVIFGSTNRKYALHIIPNDSDITVEALNDYIKKCRKLQSPCLIKSFAAGESDGFRWLRTERPTGLKQVHLFTDINCSTPEEKNNKLVFDLDSLIKESSSTGGLASDDCSLILYDVLETVSNLHAHDMYVGNPYSNPVLDKQLKPVGVVVKIPTIMWPTMEDLAEAFKADVIEAGLLIEKVANAVNLEETRWVNAKPTLIEIAEKAKNLDGYDAVCQLYLDVLEIFSKNGIKYYPRCAVDDFIQGQNNNNEAPVEEEKENVEGRRNNSEHHNRSDYSKKIRSHSHKRKSAFSKQRRHSSHQKYGTTNQQLVRNSKFIIMILLLFLFCGLVAFLLYNMEQEKRESLSVNEYSAITVLTKKEKKDLPEFVEDYTISQLENNYSGDSFAAARYSILLWFGLDGVKENRALAGEIVNKHKEYYEEHFESDDETKFWRAYLMLTGVGYERQEAEAEKILDSLAQDENGATRMVKAALILGDLYAQKTTGNREDNDKVAMKYWRLAISSGDKLNMSSYQAMDRILYFVWKGRGMPKEKEYNVFFNSIQRFAEVGYVPSQYVLAELNYRGRYLQKNPGVAMDWYRKMSENPSTHYIFRSYAMVKRANMYLSGEANQSNEAAYHWYEEAAALDNVIAMEKLVELYENNVPRLIEGGVDSSNIKDASYWKKMSFGLDKVDIRGVSEPSYIVLIDEQLKHYKEPKFYPITLGIIYANNTQENQRTTELKKLFNTVKVKPKQQKK